MLCKPYRDNVLDVLPKDSEFRKGVYSRFCGGERRFRGEFHPLREAALFDLLDGKDALDGQQILRRCVVGEVDDPDAARSQGDCRMVDGGRLDSDFSVFDPDTDRIIGKRLGSPLNLRQEINGQLSKPWRLRLYSELVRIWQPTEAA